MSKLRVNWQGKGYTLPSSLLPRNKQAGQQVVEILPVPFQRSIAEPMDYCELEQVRVDVANGKLLMSRDLMLILLSEFDILPGPLDPIDAGDRLKHDWETLATPDWIDILLEILVNPPTGWFSSVLDRRPWQLHDTFVLTLGNYAYMFPVAALQKIMALPSRQSLSPLLDEVLEDCEELIQADE